MAKRDQPSGRSLDRRPEDWFEPRLPGSASTDDIAAALAAVDINTTAPIVGGGNLDSDLTLSLSGTKAQFNASCSDGDFLYVGDITQYTDEMARDALGIALTAGAGITITPNDPADTITIASSITQYTDEMARDAIEAALVGGTNITITVNDPGDTITIDAAGASGYTDEQAQDAVGAMIADTATIDLTYTDATPELKADVKSNSIGTTQLVLADVQEIARDAIGAALIAGNGITITVSDGSDTITLISRGDYEGGPPTPPTTADFATWVNQGTSSVSDGTGVMLLKPQVDGLIHGREKATPSAPFDIYCRINMDMLSTAGITTAINNNAGILLRDSSDGELIACTIWQERISGDEQNLYGVSLDRWTGSGATFSARPILKYNNTPWKWIRVNITSTTITLYVSQDGKNWDSVGTETISTFIDTVDRYGPCALASANATEAFATFSYFSTTAPS